MTGKHTKIIAFLVMSLFATSCATATEEMLNASSNQTAKERRAPHTQYQLDGGYREQQRINEEIYDQAQRYSVCCVMFAQDVTMLAKVLAHLKQTFDDDPSLYGLVVQENEYEYVITVRPRPLANSQVLRSGMWVAQSEYELKGYQYTVDRNSLEILEYEKIIADH